MRRHRPLGSISIALYRMDTDRSLPSSLLLEEDRSPARGSRSGLPSVHSSANTCLRQRRRALVPESARPISTLSIGETLGNPEPTSLYTRGN